MTVTDKAYETAFGQPLRRKEDAHLITGQTRWTDNLNAPGMLYAAYLRSPMAHAKFTIDTTPAKSYPGVVAVFSAADFGAAVNMVCAGATLLLVGRLGRTTAALPPIASAPVFDEQVIARLSWSWRTLLAVYFLSGFVANLRSFATPLLHGIRKCPMMAVRPKRGC